MESMGPTVKWTGISSGTPSELLESVRTQGENDPYWNARMGYSCLMAYRSAAIRL